MNKSLSDAKFCRNRVVIQAPLSQFSDFYDVCLIELVVGAFLTETSWPAFEYAFIRSIPHVVSMTPEKEMIWIDAGRNITSMQNMDSFWNRTAMEFPAKTMRQYQAVPVSHVTVSSSPTSDPNPTARKGCTFDPAEKPFCDRLSLSHCRVSFQTGNWSGAGGVDALSASSIIG